MPPRVLLVTSARWIATARLATAFAQVGCEVEVVCPRGHPASRTRAVSRVHPYRALAALRSVDRAIRAARPDLVVPCDDLATSCLLDLHARAERMGEAGRARRELLEASLGTPSGVAVATARSALMACAGELGIRVPATAVVRTKDELADWLREHPGPAVLKSDGSYGGRGVRVVGSVAEAQRAWETLSSPPSIGRAIKRAAINRDTNYLLSCLRRTRPAVSAQAFVAGQDANCTVACWKGTILASISVVVLATLDSLGPSSVVRVVEHQVMLRAAEDMVGRLRLSGLIGLDFLLEQGTGDAYLIELNPRAPQVAHLPLGTGRDLPASLRAALSGQPGRSRPPATDDPVIALFPQEWRRDPLSGFLRTAYLDVPWDEPDLLRACVAEPLTSRAWSVLSAWRRRPHRASTLVSAGIGARAASAPGDGRA